MGAIAVDASYLTERPSGIGVYASHILSRLLAEDPEGLLLFTGSEKWRARHPESTAPAWRSASAGSGWKASALRFVWQQTMLPMTARRKRARVLYSPSHEGAVRPGLPQVITVHDLLPLRYPESNPRLAFYFSKLLPAVLRRCAAVICVSEFTRDDLLAHYDVDPGRVHVVLEGCDTDFYRPQPDPGSGDRFLVFVGEMRPYKNLDRALEAFARVPAGDVRFVIAGKRDGTHFPRLQQKARDLGIEDRVDFPGFLPQEKLPSLYSNALGLVFPSIHEGFGLPPLEAMASGCPVLASNAASLPEVCGDAALLVDPLRVDAIAAGMRRLIREPGLRRDLTRRGLVHVRKFSWDEAARSVRAVLEEAAR